MAATTEATELGIAETKPIVEDNGEITLASGRVIKTCFAVRQVHW